MKDPRISELSAMYDALDQRGQEEARAQIERILERMTYAELAAMLPGRKRTIVFNYCKSLSDGTAPGVGYCLAAGAENSRVIPFRR